MATEQDYQAFLDRIAALEETVADRLSSRLVSDPQLADVLVKQIDDLLQKAVEADMAVPPPPDKGLAQLVGVGPEAAAALGQTRIPQAITPYDETVSSERLNAMGDLYYIYQHEKIGVFRAVRKLQELFRAGAVYLSSGSGAYALYQFDRREVLRYTGRDRLAAYRRAFGYGRGAGPRRVAGEQRLSWAVRPLRQPGRAVLAGQADLRRDARAGLRPELRQHRRGPPGRPGPAQQPEVHLLRPRQRAARRGDAAARRGVPHPGVRGHQAASSGPTPRGTSSKSSWPSTSASAWSPRRGSAWPSRAANCSAGSPSRTCCRPSGRSSRRLLLEIAEYAEEWLTSAQSMGVAVRQEDRRVMPWDRSNLPAGGGERVGRPPLPSRPMPPVARTGGTRGRTLSQNGSRA